MNNFWTILLIYAVFLGLSFWKRKQVLTGVTGIIGLILSFMLLGDAASEFKLLGIVTIFFNIYLFYYAVFGENK